jgi:hypothetical protein
VKGETLDVKGMNQEDMFEFLSPLETFHLSLFTFHAGTK